MLRLAPSLLPMLAKKSRTFEMSFGLWRRQADIWIGTKCQRVLGERLTSVCGMSSYKIRRTAHQNYPKQRARLQMWCSSGKKVSANPSRLSSSLSRYETSVFTFSLMSYLQSSEHIRRHWCSHFRPAWSSTFQLFGYTAPGRCIHTFVQPVSYSGSAVPTRYCHHQLCSWSRYRPVSSKSIYRTYHCCHLGRNRRKASQHHHDVHHKWPQEASALH